MSNPDNIKWPGWETTRLIGRGSFGAVYEIQRKVFDETEKAALKVISIPQNSSDIEELYSDGYDDESITTAFKSHLQSIVAEYSLMRKMNGCKNIVNCDDVRYVQHDDGIGWDIYIKMELLTPLTKSLPANYSEETVEAIAKDICGALEVCKKHGIVHRDIKPQNIFVSEYGDYKLGDFGIAKTVEKTMGGTKIGTYKYMAPEVYNNQPYGSGADIYSLGLVLYWLLNERRMPFMPLPPQKLQAGMEEQSRNRRLSGEKLPDPAHGSDRLKRIVLKACAFDPKDRYQSATEMLNDLEKLHADSTPVAVVPPVSAPDPVEPIPGIQKEHRSQKQTVEKEEKKKTKIIVSIAAVIAIIIAFLLLLHSCGGNHTDNVDPTEDTSTTVEAGAGFGAWSDWSSSAVTGTETREVETRTVYRYRDQETTTGSSSSKAGWELYDTTYAWGSYGAWSSWSENSASESESRKVETKNQYRYRDISYSTEYTEWSSWSNWSFERQSTSDLKKEESRTVWGYYYYTCPGCGAHMHGWNMYCPTWAGGCGSAWISEGDWTQIYSTPSWDSAGLKDWHGTGKYYTYIDGQLVFKWNDGGSGTQYRYATRSTEQVANYGSWSNWGDNAYSQTSTREVQSRTMYRYCDRSQVPTYHFYRWGGWSDWSANSVTATGSREVETAIQYRFRDQVIVTTNYFRRWTDWTEYSDQVVTSSETVEVQTQTQYRYKSKSS